MRRLLLCGLSSVRARICRYFDRSPLRIKVRPVRVAISLSRARKRPDRSLGAVKASRASNLMEGSTRVYISVVCMLEWPSHRETFRRSFVASKTVSAQLCLSTWGDIRLVASDEQRLVAATTCFSRIYSKPARVKGSRRALRKSSGTRRPHRSPLPRPQAHVCLAMDDGWRRPLRAEVDPGPQARRHDPAIRPPLCQLQEGDGRANGADLGQTC